MAAKPETNFSNAIRKALPNTIYSMKNNNQYVAGVPDLWMSGAKGDIWVEMKFVPKLPSRAPLRPSSLLSELQKEWLNTRHKEGRNVCVIIGCKRSREIEGIILTQMEWMDDISVNDLSGLIRSKKEIAAWLEGQVM